jgi:hypothetical protein
VIAFIVFICPEPYASTHPPFTHSYRSNAHYIELDLQMKERCLRKLQSPKTRAARFKPSDRLLEFLEQL